MSSPNLGAIADAQEDFYSATGQAESVEDLRSAAEALAEAIREVGEAYTESADNMESGFGQSTYVSDEIREKADGCESWADEIESAASDLEDFDEDDARADAEVEAEDEEDADVDDLVEQKREEHLAEQLSNLESAAEAQPF
jgi:hypothetical protein